jgi:acetyltransferase
MTHAMQRCPTHPASVMQLADGSRVVLRPVLSRDRELQRAFVRALSEEARYFRFMTRLTELSEAMAERLTDIDYRSHVALIAEVRTGTGTTMIAEARYILEADASGACEFAVAVADGWQRKGLAYAMLERLAEQAAKSGIRRMAGDTVSTNTAMIRLARRLGFRTALKREDGRLVSLVRDLQPQERRAKTPGTSTPGTSLTDRTAVA